MTCEHCRHWRALSGEDEGWGTCTQVSRPDAPTLAPFSVCVVDGLLETAELYTHGPTFHCNQWAARLRTMVYTIRHAAN